MNDRETLTRLLKARTDACERRMAELLDQRRVQERTTPEKIARWLFTEAAIMRAEADFKAAGLCLKVLVEATTAGSGQQLPRPQEKERSRLARGRS